MSHNDIKIRISVIEHFALELLSKNPKLPVGEAFTISEKMIEYSREHGKQTVSDDIKFRFKVSINASKNLFIAEMLATDEKWKFLSTTQHFVRDAEKAIDDISYNHDNTVEFFIKLEETFRECINSVLINENQIAGTIYFSSLTGTHVAINEKNEISINLK